MYLGKSDAFTEYAAGPLVHDYQCENCGEGWWMIFPALAPFPCRYCGAEVSLTPATSEVSHPDGSPRVLPQEEGRRAGEAW